jgi:hypothetical protein
MGIGVHMLWLKLSTAILVLLIPLVESSVLALWRRLDSFKERSSMLLG